MKRYLSVIAIAALALVGCGDEAEIQHGFNVAADESLLGAAVQLDGRHVGTLQHLALHGSWFESLMVKIYGDSPAAHVVAANMSLDSEPHVAASHRISILQNGAEVAAGTVTTSVAREFQFYFVSGRRVDKLQTPEQ